MFNRVNLIVSSNLDWVVFAKLKIDGNFSLASPAIFAKIVDGRVDSVPGKKKDYLVKIQFNS